MLPKRFGAAGTVLLATTLAAGLACSGFAADSPLAGRWEGTVQTPGMPVTLVLDLGHGAAGEWAGSAVFPGFGVKGAPLKDVTVKDSEASFTVLSAMGDPKLTVRVVADGTLSGSYEQGGHTVPVSLKRAGAAQIDFPKPSTPIRKELEGRWEGALDFGGFKMRLGLKLASGAKGLAEGQLIMHDSGDYAAPIDLITQDGDKLEMRVAAVNFGYEGLISRSNEEFRGILRIGAFEYPLVWLRSK